MSGDALPVEATEPAGPVDRPGVPAAEPSLRLRAAAAACVRRPFRLHVRPADLETLTEMATSRGMDVATWAADVLSALAAEHRMQTRLAAAQRR